MFTFIEIENQIDIIPLEKKPEWYFLDILYINFIIISKEILFELISYLWYNFIYNSDPQYNDIGKIKDNSRPIELMIKFAIYPY